MKICQYCHSQKKRNTLYLTVYEKGKQKRKISINSKAHSRPTDLIVIHGDMSEMTEGFGEIFFNAIEEDITVFQP